MLTLDSPLLGTGAFAASDIDAAFARYGNAPPGLGAAIIAAAEDAGLGGTGLDHDFLACQVADETGWWTSDDATRRNNPAGFGHTDGAAAGDTFPSIRAGLHACVAHWLTYIDGDANPLAADDPRFRLVPAEHRGVARRIRDIGNGVWASSPDYPQAILNRYGEFLDNGAPKGEDRPMRVILSAGHLNIGDITGDKIGQATADRLRGATGALGTEARPNEAVVTAAAQALAAAGVSVLTTDANYHPEVYGQDADLVIFVHHDGVTFGDDHPQWSGASVVHSGPSTVDVDNRAQQWVDAWKALAPGITGITDEHVLTNDMAQYYGGWYRTANTPAVLVECSIWGGSDGQRPDVDTGREAAAIAAATAKFLGVNDGQIPHGPPATVGGGTHAPGADGVAGSGDDGSIPLAGDAFTAAALAPSGDGRGVSIRDNRTGLEFRIGHGFFDEWIGDGDLSDPAAALDAALGRDGAPLTREFAIVHPLIRGGRPTTVQFTERARYEYDPDSGLVMRGRVGAEAMSRFAAQLPPGSGHAA